MNAPQSTYNTLPVLLRSASKCNTLCNQIATNKDSIRSNAMHDFTLIRMSLALWVQGTSYIVILTVTRNKGLAIIPNKTFSLNL